jgi:hypothetical protein
MQHFSFSRMALLICISWALFSYPDHFAKPPNGRWEFT